MAGREKKPALLKKQMLPPVPLKEGDSPVDAAASKATALKPDAPKPELGAQPELAPSVKPVRKSKPKKTIKKNLKISFKAKANKSNKLKLSKSLFKTTKLNLDSKNVTLIKNGIKNKRKPKAKLPSANDSKNAMEGDDPPPVLEPMTSAPEENSSAKKEPKKRAKKSILEEVAEVAETNDKKQKLDAEAAAKETVEDVLNEFAQELDLDLDTLIKKPAGKKKVAKKAKAEVVPKVEDTKPKRGTPKKTKAETSKLKKAIKNESLIKSLSQDITIDSAAQNVINNLDLNVSKTAKKQAVKKRRHSIEKIPAAEENPSESASAFEQPFVLFANTRRSASPRSKRNSRIRQSIDTCVTKRFSPYTTRSDSPARILRNGKHRKLKDSQLLDGLDSEYKKRRRLCSEYSGSEISKYSGYLSESDSSFSDLASVQENGTADNLDSPTKDDASLTKSDILKKEIIDSIKSQSSSSPDVNEIQNLNIKQISTKFTAILKRSLSTETSQLAEAVLNEDVKPKINEIVGFIDTNSNDVKLPQIKNESNDKSVEENSELINLKTEEDKCDLANIVKIEKADEEQIADKIASSPSEKVPDKSLILDQMKQTFNDSNEEVEKRATRSSRRNLKLGEEKAETVTTARFYGTESPARAIRETTTQPESLDQSGPEPESEAPSEETKEEKPQPASLLETSMEVDCDPASTVTPDNSLEVSDDNRTEISLAGTDEMTTEEELQTDVLLSNGQVEFNPQEDVLMKLKGNSALSVTSIKESPPIPELNGVSQPLEKKELEITVEVNGEIKVDPVVPVIEETPENLAIKENILSALGLQSLKAAEEAKQRDKHKVQTKPDAYTGTLKTVIKLNRQGDRKKRNPLKMTLQKSKSRSLKDADGGNKSDGASGKSDGENSCYKVMKESGSSAGWRHGSHSSDTAGANRKSHYSNRSNMDGSSEHASDGDVPAADGETPAAKALVIPEKASSFSIHPGRLCSDECAYCFGKFGLFDTPLHIAQIKSVERQNKILDNEIYLMRDSCLCDACYRHVDRRVNSAAYNNKNYKRNSVLAPIPRPNYCHVVGCETESSHVLRRKWLIKMRKSVARVINIDLDNPGLHSIPICSEHYAAVEHLMVCALCKRRLARNHIHYLGFEWNILNTALEKEGIPVTLTDKPVVCKLCRYFATLLLKPPGEIKSSTANFFKQYKKRLLHFHDIEVMDEAEAEEPISVPLKEKSEKEMIKKQRKKPSKSSKNSSGAEQTSCMESLVPDTDKTDQSRVPSNSENGESCESTPSDSMVDIETLVPNMILECASDTEDNSKSEVPHKTVYNKKMLPESVREAVEISKIMKINRKNNVVERLGSNPSISVRQLFPGEEDLPLQANIDFSSVKERTPEGWEKCSCTIQYDVDTKHLWQELQKPYGNQSSFLRHLILLEKYFRNGDLTLSPNASHHAVNYSVSVQNRLRAYDNIPTNSLPMQPLTMLPFNQVKKSQSGIITTKETVPNMSSIMNAANLPKNTPIPISQLNPNFLTQLSVRQKSPGVPPGLISLQPGTSRPMAPLIKMPQKFKLPLGNSWRPTLIPVSGKAKGGAGAGAGMSSGAGAGPSAGAGAGTSSAAGDKRITGLVQVISGGKPYHISLQDYNRMCNMKKNHDMKQKVAEAKLKQREPEVSASSVLKPVVPRKPKSAAAGSSPGAATSAAAAKPTSPAAPADAKSPADRAKDSPQGNTDAKGMSAKPLMILPKIPKSLTVIPQTVARKPLQPSSPTLSITTKPSTSKS